MNAKASVIVPSLGRYERLRDCVRSIVNQRTTFPFEVVLVIDGPDSEQIRKKILSEFGSFPGLSFDVSSDRRGSPQAKNAGARVARGEILVFVDDDVIARDGWLEAIVSAHEDGIAGAGGAEAKLRKRDLLRRIWFLVRGGATGRITKSGQVISNFTSAKTDSEEVNCLAGANMSFARRAFEVAGGFDINYGGTAYREETDLCVRARKSGRLVFLPRAVVDHHEEIVGGNTPSSLRDWNYWYHRNNTYFYLKNLAGAGRAGWSRHMLSEVTIAIARAFCQRSLSPLITMSRGIRDGREIFEKLRGGLK